MPSDIQQQIDATARRVLEVYESPLARAGLRAVYGGLTAREEVDGVRESEVSVWLYRGSELADSIDVPVERPGLEQPSVEEIERRLREELWEVVALHTSVTVPARPASALAPAAEPAVPAPAWDAASWVYARRLRTLLLKILPVPAAAIAVGYIAMLIRLGATLTETLSIPLWVFAIAYIAGFPTAVVASLVHTKLMRLLGRESLRHSTILGGGVGALAGLMTPWFLPIFEPHMPIQARLAMAGIGGAVGAAYGWIVSRWHELPAEPGAVPQLEPPATA